MRVFLWHRFMIISGYNKIWNKGCVFWAFTLWVFILKNQTQAEKWRLFSKSQWFWTLYTFRFYIHLRTQNFMNAVLKEIFFGLFRLRTTNIIFNESLSQFSKMICQHCKHRENHVFNFDTTFKYIQVVTLTFLM